MTTIAWDGRYVAADTMGLMGDVKNRLPVTKLKTRGNLVYAITGFSAWFDAWIDWHQAGCDPQAAPVFKGNGGDDGNFVVFALDKPAICYSWDLPYPTARGCPESWGSGEKLALGAMLAGKSAPEAVAIAISSDPWSGGEVQVIDLASIACLASASR